MVNYQLLGCPQCGGNKSPSTRTFASYRVAVWDDNIKLICKTCGYYFKFKTIRGANVYDGEKISRCLGPNTSDSRGDVHVKSVSFTRTRIKTKQS